MAKKLTRKALMQELESDITKSFNLVAQLVVNDLSTSVEKGGYSPTLTGFYASSWKASKTPIVYNDYVKSHQPWAEKREQYEATRRRPNWVIEQRHTIPKFSIKDTIYIANTAEYTSQAFVYSRVPEYAAFKLNTTIDKAFSDKSVLSYKTNFPK